MRIHEMDLGRMTPTDVIQRSVLLHPSLLKDVLRQNHAIYAFCCRNKADACSRLITALDNDDLTPVQGDPTAMQIAFDAAADLNLIPMATRMDIQARAQ